MSSEKPELKSVVVPDSKEEGYSEIIRSVFLKQDNLRSHFDENVNTLYDVFERSLKAYPERPFTGVRSVVDGKPGDYEWSTYQEIAERRDNLGTALRGKYGVAAKDNVGIFSINRPEWVIAEQAGHAYNFCGIALYATLGANAIEYIVNHAEMKVIVCGGKNVDIILAAKGTCPNLKTIVSMDPLTDAQKTAAEEGGCDLIYMRDAEAEGAEAKMEHEPVTADDLGTIMYTSGTTGDPKGVMLTQANFVAEISGVMDHDCGFTEADVHMSYLPLAHSFERAVMATIIANGARVGFFRGIVPELFDDIGALKPTFLVGAPRVWSRLYDKVTQAIQSSGFLKRKMFNTGFRKKAGYIKKGYSVDKASPFWDKIVFKKTKARLGGNVRFILSGSAPLDPKLAEFLQVCFCCPVLQGYGLTENCAGCSITSIKDYSLGHVGGPLTCTEIRLADLPEMGYLSTDDEPRGEVCLRGPNVYKGYYKMEEKTSEVLSEDGWFRTGDVGRFNKDGSLSIIDRAKNIFKLSQGEYVAAEYLEGVYIRDPFVQQVFVYGDSFQHCLVGVIVPDPDVLLPWAKKNGLAEDLEAIVADEKAVAAIMESITATGKDANLKGFEFLKRIHLDSVPFSTENDLMTPSFKLRRPQLKAAYKEKIDSMYEDINASS